MLGADQFHRFLSETPLTEKKIPCSQEEWDKLRKETDEILAEIEKEERELAVIREFKRKVNEKQTLYRRR